MKRSSFAFIGALVSLTISCGGDLGDCPADSNAQQLAGRQIVEQRCNVCHSSQLSGAQRQSAPQNLNFDDLATVRDHAEDMYGQTQDGKMPPSGSGYSTLSDADEESVRVWLACGAQDVK